MSHRRGFTLMEVLATMVLLALVLPAVMRGTTVALSTASSAKHRTEAATLTQAKLNELIATGQWNASQTGDFSPQHPEYHWSVQSGSRDYGVYDVAVTVTWNESGAERRFVLATLAYDSTTASALTTGATP